MNESAHIVKHNSALIFMLISMGKIKRERIYD